MTGAASGIGLAIATAYARAGAHVVIGDVNLEGAKSAADQLGAECGCLDVTTAASVSDFVARVVDEHGEIGILVNNAGTNTRRALLELPEEEFDRVLAVCLKGTFLMTQAVGRLMVRVARGGAVINVASLGAFQPYPGIGHYEAAKAGVIALTRAAALELAPHQIRVNAIAPGVIETPLTAANLANPEVRSARLSRIPLGRFGRPEDVANLAVVLASDESAFMTGTVVVADGGQLLV